MAADAHCIDLSDGRNFVTEIRGALDAEAHQAQCWVISEANSVPGLSAAVIVQPITRASGTCTASNRAPYPVIGYSAA